MAWAVEYTDTLGGAANYSWARRETIGSKYGETRAAIMSRAKAAVGIAGVRGRVTDRGDRITLRPYGMCTVLFVTWSNSSEEDNSADRVRRDALGEMRMTTYRLTIDGPLWPSLSAKNGKTRSTLRGAKNLVGDAVWDAMQGLSPMDRQCEQEALAVCTSLDADGYPDEKGKFVRHEIGPFVFTLTREE